MPSKPTEQHICKQCEQQFLGIRNRKFCSQKCARLFISTNSVSRICYKCQVIFEAKIRSKRKNILCLRCRAIKNPYQSKKQFFCIKCNIIVNYGRKYCDVCLKLSQRECGLKSVNLQKDKRRGTNEALFATKCINHFSVVTCNDPIFDGWDADVLIHDLKIAVLWNGPWHYRKLRQKHSLEQVQSRDKLKVSVITQKGWIPYIIKDEEGRKNNHGLVDVEFNKLLEFISSRGSS